MALSVSDAVAGTIVRFRRGAHDLLGRIQSLHDVSHVWEDDERRVTDTVVRDAPGVLTCVISYYVDGAYPPAERFNARKDNWDWINLSDMDLLFEIDAEGLPIPPAPSSVV